MPLNSKNPTRNYSLGEGTLKMLMLHAFEPEVSEHARFRTRSVSISAAINKDQSH